MNIIKKTALLSSFFVFNLVSLTFPSNITGFSYDDVPNEELPLLEEDSFIKNQMIVGVKKETETEKAEITAEKKTIINQSIGIATYYADYFHGRRTANGETFDMNAMTCAATSKYAFGTILKVTNIENGKSVEVKVNDRGAFESRGVTLDLSKGAFEAISPLSRGVVRIEIEQVI